MDLLVKLYDLAPNKALDARLEDADVTLRRALPPELAAITEWIRRHFTAGWASEATVALCRQPVSCFIAVRHGQLLGFACYDATARGFFGPTGVDEAERGRGIGHALLLACLNDMRAQGYAYAAIGDVGPVEFYARTVGATPIADSTPGIFAGLLKASS
ncbi:GNAT family N-acetyltransferase [Labrys neptuniae]|uniref:GNAT family N-acetyltransferase n=1 Tax=Labrys neptuniae TaxID=376174 RepID=UPI00288D9EF6|nr:GNAT family N-acetyltransferase [Labrys neptuniae]MDT3376314.1 GNAT family N-acetyltransferase [Labrys neptuniae]